MAYRRVINAMPIKFVYLHAETLLENQFEKTLEQVLLSIAINGAIITKLPLATYFFFVNLSLCNML